MRRCATSSSPSVTRWSSRRSSLPSWSIWSLTRVGVESSVAAIRELAGGAYHLAQVDARELDESASVMERYADQEIGVTDASLVVLAHRYSTKDLLTLDRRHFNVVRPIDGGRFTLLPG